MSSLDPPQSQMEGSHLQRWSHCEVKWDNSSTPRCWGDRGQDYRDMAWTLWGQVQGMVSFSRRYKDAK